MILAAAVERGIDKLEDEKDRLPSSSNRTPLKWEELVQQLGAEILWNTDWDLPPEVLDMPPEQQAKWGGRFRVSEDYFTDLALDPTPSELAEVRRRLDALQVE